MPCRAQQQNRLGLPTNQAHTCGTMDAFGAKFAAAGEFALKLALDRARRQLDKGCIPIAGAAVEVKDPSGELVCVSVGHNGRIPPRDDASACGYPTDHGETACVRGIAEISACDWSKIVFATTLAPCIMCTRTLQHLHGMGLRMVVVAEASSFRGGIDVLRALPGMVVVTLAEHSAMSMMNEFSRRFPWDWDADIGEIPPRDCSFADRVAMDVSIQKQLLQEVVSTAQESSSSLECNTAAAAVVTAGGELLRVHSDSSGGAGGNPTLSAVMLAMGCAGSRVNLRECVLVWSDAQRVGRAGIHEFGLSSVGACELFRPAVILCRSPLTRELQTLLECGGSRVVVLEQS